MYESDSESDASDDEKEDSLKGMSIKNMDMLKGKLKVRLKILYDRHGDACYDLKDDSPRERAEFYIDLADRIDSVEAGMRAIEKRLQKSRDVTKT